MCLKVFLNYKIVLIINRLLAFLSLISYLDIEATEKNFKVLTLFVCDIFENKSYCIYNTSSSDIIKSSFKLDEVYEGVSIDGVLSRKMQIVPYIMDTLDK